MPLDKYLKGKGEKAMKSFKKTYGEEEGEHIFYATANKKKQKSKHNSLRGLQKAAKT